MACPYGSNSFCAGLPEDVRRLLCADCKIKTYPAKSIRDIDYWRRGPSLLVSGFAAFGNTDNSQGKAFTTCEYVKAGEFVNWGPSIEWAVDPSCLSDYFELYCFTDCSIALLNQEVFQELYETNVHFLQSLVKFFNTGWGVAEAMLSCGTAYDKLRFYLDYCRRAGFHYATHE